uniref:Uncharacterized protein n=1 Tax=Rhizophora mucronata TaxID=61149 RepID=A0A2P2PUY2_RHIMU
MGMDINCCKCLSFQPLIGHTNPKLQGPCILLNMINVLNHTMLQRPHEY